MLNCTTFINPESMSYSLSICLCMSLCLDKMIISIGFDSCRLCRAMGGAEKVEIEWGNHSLSNRVEEAVQAIMNFVKREGPSGWDDPWS